MATSIFAGCNRNLGIFDYNSNLKIAAYGSHNTISISSPIIEDGKYNAKTQIIRTLTNHNGEITNVMWLHDTNILLSGCQDGDVNVWKFNGIDDVQLLQSMKPTSGSISCIGTTGNAKDLEVVIGDSRGRLFYYKQNEGGDFEEVTQFELPYGFYAMALSVVNVSTKERIIIAGGSKPAIHVLSVDLDTKEINLETSLTGHDDWVRSITIRELEVTMKTVDGVTYPKRTVIFATGSLDRIIRLWKLTIEDSSKPVYIETNKLKLLTSKEFKFETDSNRYVIFLDAILMGHDDWISTVSWKPTSSDSEQDLLLLSSSADSSIMIWKSDPVSGVWFPDIRLGDIAIKGASTATGSSGGFYTSQWIVDESGNEIILTNGKTGSFRCWTRADEKEQFKSINTYTGAIRPITDINWYQGEYALVTSLDQSTRLYALYEGKWFEFGRPQIHGFDMITVKPISGTRFVSAGDEKVIRVFDMPKNIAQMLNRVCGLRSLDSNSLNESLPESASLPVLGLSNKAALDNSSNSDEQNGDETNGLNKDINNEIMDSVQGPLLEDVLQRHTLWPEIEKLYGHGFEITTLDVSNDGKIIASACRSNVSKHAVIRNFNTNTWLETDKPLFAHDLTITRLRFSNKSEKEYLLSVSRDRKFSLWVRVGDDFELVAIKEKAHNRIIWDCAWTNFDNVVSFVTCSRDKEVKLWRKSDDSNEVECKGSIKFESSAVTAVDSAKLDDEGNFKLVIGLDNGEIYVYKVNVLNYSFDELRKVDSRDLPGDGISRISISPKVTDNTHTVAVGSKDNSLRFLVV
ncbi:hypothetical protein JL09_g1382 [Pichia kudriavzevii]|uniref:Elongator complex protein 2 n=1 Tax=Pichia kudriavzevii TaxID=4909 RepID=A0A099P5C9_PICKU|nr:hypothetical protein JL09_g1382 [Pichia kudriavzevii]